MKKSFLIIIALLCISSSVFAKMTNDIGFGVSSPFKVVSVDGEKIKGIAFQLNFVDCLEKSNGVVFLADCNIGPFFYYGDFYDTSLADSDSKPLFFMDINLAGGVGYNFLHDDLKQNLILSALVGLDILTNKSNVKSYEAECDVICFELGANCIYSVKVDGKFSIYGGCACFAGIGWNHTKVTEKSTLAVDEKIVHDDYGKSYMFTIQPKIGILYRF